MRIADLSWAFGRAVRALGQGRTTNVLSVICIGLLMAVLSLTFTAYRASETLLGHLRSEAEVVAFVVENAGPKEVQGAIEQLSSRPGVFGVTYVDPAQAKEEMEDLYGDLLSLDELEGVNPFLGYLALTVAPERAAEVAELAAELAIVEAVRDNAALLERLGALSRLLRILGAIFASAVLFMTAVVVSQLVRLGIHARKEEIETMRLLGASEQLVRAPFVCEGLLVSGCGGLLAAGATLALLPGALARLRQSLPFMPIPDGHAGALAAGLLAISLGAGLLGSVVATASPSRRTAVARS